MLLMRCQAAVAVWGLLGPPGNGASPVETYACNELCASKCIKNKWTVQFGRNGAFVFRVILIL